jgi:predicted MFS family arabinose efflux permease
MPSTLVDRAVLRYTLGNRDFRLLWGDTIFNGFGMSGEQVVLSLLVYQVTGSSVWVGIALALYFVPGLLVGVLAGVIADWMDRRALLRRCELAVAVALGLFGLLLSFDLLQLNLLLVMAVVSGTLRALYSPARLSYAYDLVGPARAVGGLSMINIGFRVGQLAGALSAGVLTQHVGVDAAYLSLALGHAIAYLLAARLRSSGVASEPDNTPLRENLRTLFAEMRSNRNLSIIMMVMVSVGIFGFSYITVLPELATVQLGMGAQELGIMHAARAAGGLSGVIVLVALGASRRKGTLLIATIAVFGIGLVLLGLSTTFVIVIVALVVTAATSAVYDVLTQSVMQVIVPNKLRGRAMGILVLVIGIEPAGHIMIGASALIFGVGLALQINGAVLLLIVLAVLLGSPRLRKL